MVIAESPQLDPGLVIAILLVLLVSFLAAATVVGLAGTWLGRRLARGSDPAPSRRTISTRRRAALGLGGVGAALVSWSLLLLALPGTVGGVGAGAFLVAGLPLPVAWGWWTERRGHWGAVLPPTGQRPPPDPPAAAP